MREQFLVEVTDTSSGISPPPLHVVGGSQRDNMEMMGRARRGGGRPAVRRGMAGLARGGVFFGDHAEDLDEGGDGGSCQAGASRAASGTKEPG